MTRVWKVSAVLLVILALAGGSFYAGTRHSVKTSENSQSTIEKDIASHPLLAQRVFADQDNNSFVNFEPLRSQLRKELEPYGSPNASLYFEYLPTGTSIRIGDNTQLIGASLLKLPYVMDLYHLEEYKDFNLDDNIVLKKEWLNDQYGDLYKKGEGAKVKVSELITLALEDSDNTALNAIKAIVTEYKLPAAESSFNALDVDFSGSTATQLSLTARAYSSFIKCLYYACYVSPDHSQQILDYLSKSEVETDRMTKYLPTNLTVSHKIGTLADQTQGDCGIVYLEHRNYALCMLVNDTDEKGSETIAKLSKDVYDYVSKIK